MKTPEEWINEWFPPNDSPNWPIVLTRWHIEAIQKDALSDTFADTTAQQEFEMAQSQCEKLELDVEFWKAEAERMKAKWHEARRYLRAANKGAERNSMVMRLQAEDVSRLLKRLEQLEKLI